MTIMHITLADPPAEAPWADVLASGVKRSWLATEQFGGSRAAQVSVTTLPPRQTFPFAAFDGERICVLLEGTGKLLTGDEARALEKGAVIHSTSGAPFTIRAAEGTTKLLILSETLHGPRADVERPPGTGDLDQPVECFSLFDVTDEVLHQPEAGFFHMGTRMLLNASQGGYQAFIIGQSSFAPDMGLHALHRHPGADEMFYVWDGEGAHLDADGTEHPMRTGDAVLIPRNEWHGFRNTRDRPVRAFFSLIGTGVMHRAGNEVLRSGVPVDAFAIQSEQRSGPTWIAEARTGEP